MNELNPRSIASYDLQPGNGVVTVMVEREVKTKYVKQVEVEFAN